MQFNNINTAFIGKLGLAWQALLELTYKLAAYLSVSHTVAPWHRATHTGTGGAASKGAVLPTCPGPFQHWLVTPYTQCCWQDTLRAALRTAHMYMYTIHGVVHLIYGVPSWLQPMLKRLEVISAAVQQVFATCLNNNRVSHTLGICIIRDVCKATMACPQHGRRRSSIA